MVNVSEIPIEGFHKESGYSFEDIEAAIKGANVEYSVEYGPKTTHKHFRGSWIKVTVSHAPMEADKDMEYQRVTSLAIFQGNPISDIHSTTLKAFYEIPGHFDTSRLEGLALEDGKAVEATHVSIRNTATERGYSQALDG